GKIADLIGDDGESFAALARLRRDDRRVQREEIRLTRDLIDDADDLADFLRAIAELTERELRFLDGDLNLAHAVDGAFDRLASFGRGILHVPRQLRRLLRRPPNLLGRRI